VWTGQKRPGFRPDWSRVVGDKTSETNSSLERTGELKGRRNVVKKAGGGIPRVGRGRMGGGQGLGKRSQIGRQGPPLGLNAQRRRIERGEVSRNPEGSGPAEEALAAGGRVSFLSLKKEQGRDTTYKKASGSKGLDQGGKLDFRNRSPSEGVGGAAGGVGEENDNGIEN